jgi:hypothetical protein
LESYYDPPWMLYFSQVWSVRTHPGWKSLAISYMLRNSYDILVISPDHALRFKYDFLVITPDDMVENS